MSDITAVPLRPVKKGTLTRLWIGVGAAVVAAAGIAWAGTQSASAGTCGASAFAKGAKPVTLPSGLAIHTVKPGAGNKPTDTDVVLVNYKGALTDGTVFDEGQRVPFPVAGMIDGFTEGLKQMQTGGAYRLCIPSAIGYGAQSPSPKIPANSTLIFDVDLIDFRSQAEIQAMQMQMQQQGMAPPGAPPPGR